MRKRLEDLTDDEFEQYEHDMWMSTIATGVAELERRARLAREPIPMDPQIQRWRRVVAEWREEVRARDAQ